MIVSGVVEGAVDDAVLRRLLWDAGHGVGPIHVKNGKAGVLAKLHGYNAAAEFGSWLVLVDLNGDESCAPTFAANLLPNPGPGMRLRVAVRQVEAWLLADKRRFAQFLRVGQARIPENPDALADAKQFVVDLARRSSSSSVRADLVPTRGSGRRVGPGYVPRMIEFIESAWAPDEASSRSESLRRCVRCIASMTGS